MENKNKGLILDDINFKTGLTNKQVAYQVKSDLKNIEPAPLTRSNKQIISSSVFTLFNGINVILGFLVFLTGSYKNMLFLGVVVINTLIGIIQELRSKSIVDKMAILSRSKVKVRRNNKTVLINSSDIVLGDIIILSNGDQVPVDGKVLQTNGLEVDESAITGEDNSIPKKNNSHLTSGSYIISGHAVTQATKVGRDSFINVMAQRARIDKSKDSILLELINKIIRIVTFVLIPLGLLLFWSRILRGVKWDPAILGTVAAVIGMIPEGLVLLTSVTLALSALTLAMHKVLVRDLPAIETLARVNVLCLDKTGTITTQKLKFEKEIFAKNIIENNNQQFNNQMLGATLHAIDDDNETALTLKEKFTSTSPKATRIVPFSSARKWSGASFAKEGNFVLGAPEFIGGLTKEQREQADEYAQNGYRVIAFAKAGYMDPTTIKDTKLISLLILSDVIRPTASTTLKYFASQGVSIKVISGDSPQTVSHIAKMVGIYNSDKYVDMSKVGDKPNYIELVKKYVVFGRVKPQQKQALIKAYQKLGKTVSMTGDGINDLLALKQSDCGIAMASGSESAKGIADFVLINSNFDSLVDVLKEGRRVINNIDSIASLYLIKTTYSMLLASIFVFLVMNYPFQPIQLLPINVFMVGIPSLILSVQPNYGPIRNQFLTNIYQTAIPTALTIVCYVVGIAFLGNFLHFPYIETSSLSVFVTGICCWFALCKLSFPLNKLKFSLVVFSLICFITIFSFFGKFFSLSAIFNLGNPYIALNLIIIFSAFIVFVIYNWIGKYISNIFRHKYK